MKIFWSIVSNYWLRALGVAILGVYISSHLDETEWLLNPRYWVSDRIQGLSPRDADAQRTAVVEITDEEFWKGELHGRTPIRRDYVARLVDAAVSSKAAVIALDFDFRSTTELNSEPPEFQAETNTLRNAIYNATNSKGLNQGTKLVLTRSIGMAPDGSFFVEPDIYGTDLLSWPNVYHGYHVLPDDVRSLPLTLQTKTSGSIDSFALAIARADKAPSLKRINERNSYYSGFLTLENIPKITADELLRGNRPEALENRVIIISGVWHQDGYRRGDIVRSWNSPVGTIPGVYVHANYFEALFDKRFYRLLEGWPVKGIEILLSLMVAIPFHFGFGSWWKSFLMILLPYFLVALISCTLLLTLGWFFDPSIPLLAIALHGLYERFQLVQ